MKALEKYAHAHLVQCHSCNFVFCNAIPTVEELIAHYNTYPRNDSISPITIKRFRQLLDEFEHYKNTGNILDVGCGNGHFLYEAKSKGWNVYGTEYTDTAVEICRKKGINMKKGKLNPDSFNSLKFDVITSFEVMEHINNPMEEVYNFNQLLREGGIVYVTTPNFNSLSRLLLKEQWSIIEYPEHLCYYTAQTLNRLFSASGFRKKNILTTGISMNRLNQGKNEPQASSGKNADEALREKTESNPFFGMIKNMVNAILSLSRKGDTLKGIFIKQSK